MAQLNPSNHSIEKFIDASMGLFKLHGFTEEEIYAMHLPAKLQPYEGVSKINRQHLQVVAEPFAVDFSYRGEEFLLVIDKGHVTNLATVPRIFHWVINPDNKYVRQQAIAHDALVNEYEFTGKNRLYNGYLLINHTTGRWMSTVEPKFADIIFRELIEEGIKHNWKLKEWKANAKAAICYGAITAWRMFMPLLRIFK
jgi:hypothetical protein